RRAFAEALLAVCSQNPKPARPAPALGAGGEVQDFQRRLTMIMRNSDPGRLSRWARLGVGALVLLAVPAWTFGQSAPAQPAQPPAVLEPKGAELHVVPLTFNLEDAVLLGGMKVVDDGQPSDMDKKIAELERKMRELLREIEMLRAQQARRAQQ